MLGKCRPKALRLEMMKWHPNVQSLVSAMHDNFLENLECKVQFR